MKDDHPGNGNDPRLELLSELVGLHAQAMQRMPWIQTLLIGGIALLVRQHVPLVWLIGWGLASIAVEVLRAAVAQRILSARARWTPVTSHRLFVVLAGMSGLAIGCGSVMFLPSLPILDQALLGIVLFAIPAAGTAVSQSSPPILGAYAAGVLLPASGTWIHLYPSQLVVISVLTLLYVTVLVLVTADGQKLLRRSILIRHERDRLILDLEQRNAEVATAMQQAENAAKARSRVLAAASHDLRQPLHALSVYNAVLASSPSPQLLAEASQNIGQIVRSLGAMLNSLLDLSRFSPENYAPVKLEVSLQHIVAEVCAEFREAARQKGLALVEEFGEVRVMGDPVAIARIARNLIDNAIKYTTRGEVRVSTRTELVGGEQQAVLVVADTGCGIAPGEHARIFEEFYQLDNPGRDRAKGVGLGLAIVQRLCELTGSRIHIESVPERGSTFKVMLPALITAPQAAATMAASPANHQGGQRVFLIDDEQIILHSMRTLLVLWGYRVDTAASAREAEALFDAAGVPDLLIIDLRLGPDNGAELAQQWMHR
ncbi:MAG: response regulator, partial [Proteobacteria bacterium]|nr:response regulator [Pseudomonadota bacterium]